MEILFLFIKEIIFIFRYIKLRNIRLSIVFKYLYRFISFFSIILLGLIFKIIEYNIKKFIEYNDLQIECYIC